MIKMTGVSVADNIVTQGYAPIVAKRFTLTRGYYLLQTREKNFVAPWIVVGSSSVLRGTPPLLSFSSQLLLAPLFPDVTLRGTKVIITIRFMPINNI